MKTSCDDDNDADDDALMSPLFSVAPEDVVHVITKESDVWSSQEVLI